MSVPAAFGGFAARAECATLPPLSGVRGFGLGAASTTTAFGSVLGHYNCEERDRTPKGRLSGLWGLGWGGWSAPAYLALLARCRIRLIGIVNIDARPR